MATYKTNVIILSSYGYREHDKIVSCFSDTYGRMDVRARGARKIVSKLAGSLEPFIETELLLAHGRRWDILAGSRTVQTRTVLRNHVDRIAAASVCVEAIKLIARPLASDKRLYQLLKEALTRIEETSDATKHRNYAAQFLWVALEYAGFRPELERCIATRVPINEGSFSFEGGGVLSQEATNKDAFALPISNQVITELRTNSIASPESEHIILQYWKQVIDHAELRSWRFLDALTSTSV